VSRIAVLADDLVNQIAAGEVVERPASAVKELVENALDAGARQVAVEADRGGLGRLLVTDDGCGMEPGDARLALERHATSKIRSFQDLAAVGTLGFRGEALPSIASVSRLTLTTSPDGSGLGTRVVADRGAEPFAAPSRAPRGTSVLVEDLFGNVPARRKFLKSVEAETRAIVRTVTTQALARPDVAFRLDADGRPLVDLPATDGAVSRFTELLFRSGLRQVTPLDHDGWGMRLTGAVSRPETTFASRTHQWLFVNGRAVKDPSVSHAATLASREALRDDRHPAFVLFLTVDPTLCDVNVHPQKLEVRFREPAAIHSLVHRALLAALGGAKTAVPLTGGSLTAAGPAWGYGERATGAAGPAGAAGALAEAIGIYGEAQAMPGPLLGGVEPGPSSSAYAEETRAASPLGPLRLLGQYRESFLVAESAEGLVLVDQHVAHERVRYERIRSRLAARDLPSQQLLMPVPFDASPEEAATLRGADDLLSAAGFVVSELSGRSFLVSSAPVDCAASAVVPSLRDFLARLLELPETSAGGTADRRRDALAASLACRGAITINTRLVAEEAVRLLADLSACADPYTCPHGRPILLSLAHGELVKRFGRSS